MTQSRGQSGVSLLELLVVMAVLGLSVAVAANSLMATEGALVIASNELENAMKLARARAMSTTTPHRVHAPDRRSITVEHGGPCGDPGATWTAVPNTGTSFENLVALETDGWSVCFTTRGWTTDVHTVRLEDPDGWIETTVLLGGSVRAGDVHRAL